MSTNGRPFHASERFVDQVTLVLLENPVRDRPGGGPPEGSVEYAKAVDVRARMLAEVMWAESFAAGAQWAKNADSYVQQYQRREEEDVIDRVEAFMPQRSGDVFQLRRQPLPFLMSVITPEEYRPDQCPVCSDRVTEWAVQKPVMPNIAGQPALVGRSDRVRMKPCGDLIRFIDDTSEVAEWSLGHG